MKTYTYFQTRAGCAAALGIKTPDILDKKITRLRDKGVPTFGEKIGSGYNYPFSLEQIGMLSIALRLNYGPLSDGKIGYIFYHCRENIFSQVNSALNSASSKDVLMVFQVFDMTEMIVKRTHSLEGWSGKNEPCEFTDPLFLSKEDTYKYIDDQTRRGVVHLVAFSSLVRKAVEVAQSTPPKIRGRSAA